MRALKLIAVLSVAMFGASVALADSTDPQLTPVRGPSGSPPPPESTSFLVPGDSQTTPTPGITEFTVSAGQTLVEEVLSVANPSDALNVTCGVSNALMDGGTFSSALGGFASTYNSATQTSTCTYTAFTGEGAAVDDGSLLTEAMLEGNCAAYNGSNELEDPSGIAADCIGIPGGTPNSDVVFSVLNESDTAITVTADSTVVPEPSSAAMLTLGLVGLGFLAYRRRQQLAL